MSVPAQPKLYHIVHVDRLSSILADGCLWCDAEVSRRELAGTNIGMNAIKSRRLNENMLQSHPSLMVGKLCSILLLPALNYAVSYLSGQPRGSDL